MRNVPRPGIEPMSPVLGGRFLSTAPPRNSVFTCFSFEASVRIFFLFKVEYCFTACIYHIWFMHSFFDRCLSSSVFLSIMNNAAVNRVYRYPVESLLSILLGIYLRSRIVQCYNNFIIVVTFIVCP